MKAMPVWLTLLMVSAAWLLSACVAQDVPKVYPPEPLAALEDAHKTAKNENLAWFEPTDFISAGWILQPDAERTWLSLQPKQSSGQVVKLLFIHSSKTNAFDRSVSKVLSVFTARNLTVEALVVLPNPDNVKDSILEALEYAETQNFDLVYTVGSGSTAIVHENYNGGALPVVTVLAKDPVLLKQVKAYDQGGGANIAYTSVSVPVDVQMVYLRQVMPEVKNIILVYEGKNVSTVDTQVNPLKAYVTEHNLDITVWDVAVEDPNAAAAELEKMMPEVLAQVRAAGGDTFFLIPASRSIQGAFDLLVQLAGDTPVFSLYPDIVREGLDSAVLAIGVGFDSNSLLAGAYGIRILLDGEKPGEMLVGVIRPPDIAVNFAKARQLGLQIPFGFFESANLVYGPDGNLAR